MARNDLPILMHHRLGDAGASKASRFLCVSPAAFARQMRLLARLGYRGVTLGQAADGLFRGAPLPRRPVCVTFDDGYASVVEHAAPVLDRLGWPATVFLPTDHIGLTNGWDAAEGRLTYPLLGWDALKEIARSGWELAGHTASHARLGDLAESEAADEIRRGAEAIARELGTMPRTFCYPYGSFNEATPGLVRRCGFVAACTTRSGLAGPSSDPFLLPRVKVAYRDGVAGLLYRMWIRPRLG